MILELEPDQFHNLITSSLAQILTFHVIYFKSVKNLCTDRRTYRQ